MGRKQDDFMNGMEAGARPFAEKFKKLSEEPNKIVKSANTKLDVIGEVVDILADDLSDMQKKKLYDLNTPYDLKEELDSDEKEIVAALLLALSEYTENNEYQKKFIRAVNTYIDVKSPQTGFDVECIENIENIKSQKIIMQTIMEYLYLANEDFTFLDKMEEVFDHFSVNKKGIREIESYIEKIYRATGKDGIAEKYGFVPKEEAKSQAQTEQEEKKVYEFPYYDGSDISETCADKINTNSHYIVLKDYLVYCEGDYSSYKRIYRVHKQTGETKEIEIDIEDKTTISRYNVCGYDKYIYLVHTSGIYMMNVETDISMTKIKNIESSESILEKDEIGNPIEVFPECNEQYLIYSIIRKKRDKEYETYYCINLQTMEEDEIELENIREKRYKLVNNIIYFIGDDYFLYKYNIETREQKRITQLDYEAADTFLGHYNTTNDGKLTNQCKKYLISVKSTWYSDGGIYYYCLDVENDLFDSINIQNTYGYRDSEFHCFVAYDYIYFYSTSSIIERYNILTREKEEVIKTDTIFNSFKKGFFRTEKSYISVHEINIVGNWMYYRGKDGDYYKVNIKEKKINMIMNYMREKV